MGTRGVGLLTTDAALLVLADCSTRPDHSDCPVSHAHEESQDTRIGRRTSRPDAKHPRTSGFSLRNDSLDAFVAGAVLTDAAERSIDAEYYLLHRDLTGRLFIDRLLAAALSAIAKDRNAARSGRTGSVAALAPIP